MSLPSRVIDITGHKFGRLTAVSYRAGKWLCRCDCGGETRTSVSKLRSGHSRSCGCLSTERIAKLNRVDRYCGRCHCGDHAFAILTRGFIGLVSPEDDHHLANKSWNAHRSTSGGWAVTGTHAKKLHRAILAGTPADMVIDHRNGNPFDNRRCNLRTCTNEHNVMNQKNRRGMKHSRFKGVTWNGVSQYKPWTAQISAAGRRHHLGIFATEAEAAMAYDEAATRLHGEFARTNASLGRCERRLHRAAERVRSHELRILQLVRSDLH